MVDNLTKPTVVMGLLKKYNFKMSKSLGQNFLVDDGIRQKIIACGELSPDDVVVEIGPGLGVLTQALLDKGCQVIAIELDRRVIPILEDNFRDYPNFHIINQDVLKVNLDQLVSEKTGAKSYKVMANLPYYITTPIIMHLLESRFSIEVMVFMMQKEVAERIVGQPGTKAYGGLTVSVQYFTQPTMVFTVPNTVFIPKPDVESAVVRFLPRLAPPVELDDPSLFFQVVRAAFGQRRKTLLNALRGSSLGLTKEQAEEVLHQAEIDLKRRGETLDIMEFGHLANLIQKVLRSS